LKHKLKKSKTFCMAPWVHLYVHTDNTVWSCCVSKQLTQHNIDYKKTDILKYSESDIINNEYFKKLRLDMLNGVKNKNCSDCYLLEKTTGHSARKEFNREFKEDHFDKVIETHEDGSIDNFETVYLDFRFSNKCNFKCRSCNPKYSTTWAKESKGDKNHPYFDYSDTIDMIKGKEVFSKEDFLNRFRDTLKTVKIIDFAGGEPLAQKEHYWILEHLIDIGRTDVFLKYSTNLSMLKSKKLKLNVVKYWKKLTNIMLLVSLDGSGERAEYIRSGTDWKLIEENFKYVKENLPHIDLGIQSVFQMCNALHLPDFYQNWIDDGIINMRTLHNINLIPLTGPEWLSSQTLAKELKIEVEVKWEKFIEKNHLPPGTHQRVLNCLEYMNSEDGYIGKWKKLFESSTSYLDKIRNENFNDVFPELRDYYEC